MTAKRVLLTGANSLVGSHILDQLLSSSASAQVRAVVGSSEDAHQLAQRYPQAVHRLDYAIVSPRDVSVPGAYDEALSGYPPSFDTVIHTVAAEPTEEADCLSRFIHLQTDALINFVRSVKDVAPGVRRVVVVTCLTPFARWLVDPEVDRSSPGRRNSTIPIVAEVDADDVLVTSQASDNIVYEALLKWIREAHARSASGPRFDLVSVTAPSVYGPSIRSLENSSDLEEANRRIWNICSNDANERVTSPPYGIEYFTDVRDLALASIRAVFEPRAGGRRFVVSAGTMPSGTAIADFLRHRFPELGSRIRPDGSPPRRPPARESPLEFVDAHLAASILGMTRYLSVEVTLTDLAGQILELHQRKEWKRVIQS